jgi:SP family general alpha glucoside:H+ symporter-like MFS transporter
MPLFLIITFAPESPWFLVRRGRLEEAEKTVRRLGSTTENRDPSQVVAMMVGITH